MARGISDVRTRESTTWPQQLRALAAQRPDEPHVARARDLAETYHDLHYYSCAYATPEDAPPKLLGNRVVVASERRARTTRLPLPLRGRAT